jgi:hypothetical protein
MFVLWSVSLLSISIGKRKLEAKIYLEAVRSFAVLKEIVPASDLSG